MARGNGRAVADLRVTALALGDGPAVAALWRDLWILHESWNGYPAMRDRATYVALSEKLESWARRRNADPVLGQHVHLVARDRDGRAVGQIEGWLDRHGVAMDTPTTCEIRSLIVDPRARGRGIGRLLLGELEKLACQVSRGAAYLVAEVLVPNPAIPFYEKLGYRPISTTMMVPLDNRVATPARGARLALASDAMAMTRLEMQRRIDVRARGDLRLDRPTALDAAFAQAVSRHLATSNTELLAFEDEVLIGQGSLSISTLEAPFAPVVRAALGRLALVRGEIRGAAALLTLARERARRRGARRLEIADLPVTEASALAAELQRAGATPFSRIVGRLSR